MNSIKKTIYLDHAATTPIDPRVFEAMVPFLKEHYGNASSVHRLGRKARFAIEDARERMAAHFGITPGELIFTSGGTESNNLALKGQRLAGKLVTSKAEHEAILKQTDAMQRAGWSVELLDPQEGGVITKGQVEDVLDPETRLVSLMHVNNETGGINPIQAIGNVLGHNNMVFHCDAVQSIGLYDWQLEGFPVDIVTGSSHKIYGPKGAGFLYVRGGTELNGLIEGGSQERKRRGGTENVAAIVGMAKALDLAVAERSDRVDHIRNLKQRLMQGIRAVFTEAALVINSLDAPEASAPHIVNIAFPPIGGEVMDGEMLILNFDMEGICVSSGSACTSGAIEPSHVLLAMGLDDATASAAVRFSIGKDNTAEEIDYTIDRLQEIVIRMRGALHA